MFLHYFSGAITTDLRQYLNTRFPKGDVDHELQNTIRDNLYNRTVPVTTRTPRPEERHGVDYTFLSKEEFVALEKSGELLESGIYDGKFVSVINSVIGGGWQHFILRILDPTLCIIEYVFLYSVKASCM